MTSSPARKALYSSSSLFKDRKKQLFLRKAAQERDIIVLTDSDHAGFMIRNFVAQLVGEKKVIHVFMPDIYGKEKRKTKPSAEGKLGVEGIDDRILIDAFRRHGVIFSARSEDPGDITAADMFELGFTGKADSANRRKKLAKSLILPENISLSRMIQYINMTMKREEFLELVRSMVE